MYWCHGYLLVQSADYRLQTANRIQNVDCRLQTGYKMQTADCRPDTKCRLQSGYKMQTENLKSFFVWHVITCHLTTYRVSRIRFSAISFHDYLHCCGILLAHFLIKIDCNIISSLHCARVGWCDVCTDFTNVIEVDEDVNEMSLLNI